MDKRRIANARTVWDIRMTTKLDSVLKRELTISGELYTLTISPEGFLLTVKGHRNGLDIAWADLVGGDAALATALNASLTANIAPRGKPPVKLKGDAKPAARPRIDPATIFLDKKTLAARAKARATEEAAARPEDRGRKAPAARPKPSGKKPPAARPKPVEKKSPAARPKPVGKNAPATRPMTRGKK
jgi:hypothetical protein